MKLKTTLCLTLLLTVLTVSPAFAQTVSSEKRLQDLSNRLNAFESNWNRFQIGGDLNLRSSTAWLYTPQTLKPLNFDQQLNLFLDTFFDRNISLSLKLAHNGEWGSKYYNQTYGSTPMATPLQLDEAFLRLQYPTSLNYLGRFRFSLSPLGLISDFYTIPVEGFSIQKTFRQFHVIGLYSRINTQYELAENSVKNIVAEDYWAARLGWSSRQHIIGINLVPDGVTYERNISVDWSYQWSGQKLIVEAAWYAFTPPDRSVYSVASGEDPGFLICYGKNLPKNSYFQLKGGYFGANFKPSYSSLSDTSGDEREWFVSNSYGVELLAQNQIRPGWSWENRVLFFKPLVHYAQSTDGYHFTSKIIKSFTPVNQAQLGVESKSINSATDNRIFASWNLRF